MSFEHIFNSMGRIPKRTFAFLDVIMGQYILCKVDKRLAVDVDLLAEEYES
jgi:hypothetical protein